MSLLSHTIFSIVSSCSIQYSIYTCYVQYDEHTHSSQKKASSTFYISTTLYFIVHYRTEQFYKYDVNDGASS